MASATEEDEPFMEDDIEPDIPEDDDDDDDDEEEEEEGIEEVDPGDIEVELEMSSPVTVSVSEEYQQVNEITDRPYVMLKQAMAKRLMKVSKDNELKAQSLEAKLLESKKLEQAILLKEEETKNELIVREARYEALFKENEAKMSEKFARFERELDEKAQLTPGAPIASSHPTTMEVKTPKPIDEYVEQALMSSIAVCILLFILWLTGVFRNPKSNKKPKDEDALEKESMRVRELERVQKELELKLAAEAKEKADAERRAIEARLEEAKKLKDLESMVEQLRFENETSTMLLESQKDEIGDLRKSVLDLKSEVSDVRRSNSSFNVLNSGTGEQVRGLRQSNQDLVRQSRLSLSSLRQSRDSFTGVASNLFSPPPKADTRPPSSFFSPAVDNPGPSYTVPMSAPLPRRQSPSVDRVDLHVSDSQFDDGNDDANGNDAEASYEDYRVDMESEYSEYDEEHELAAMEEEREAIMMTLNTLYENSDKDFVFEEGSIGLMFSGFSSFEVDGPHGASIAVTHVFEEGQAHSKGIQCGDLIMSLNGEVLPSDMTKDEFFDLLQAAPRPVSIGFRLQLNE